MALRRKYGTGSWYTDADGRHHWMSSRTGPDGGRVRTHLSGRDEVELQARVRAHLAAVDPAALATLPAPETTTFAGWVDGWLLRKARTRSAETVSWYAGLLRNHCRGLDLIPLGSITVVDIERTISSVDRAPTRAAVRKALSSVFADAVRRGVLARNPVAATDPERVPDEDIAVWTEEEFAAAMKAANGTEWAARLAVMACGLRQSERLGLRWEDVVLDGPRPMIRVRRTAVRAGWLHGCASPHRCGVPSRCPQRTPKPTSRDGAKTASGTRDVAIPTAVVSLLLEHRQRQGEMRARWVQSRQKKTGVDRKPLEWNRDNLVFCNRDGKPEDHRNDRRKFDALADAAGVRRVRPHSMRHLYATLALASGADPRTIAEQAGWSMRATMSMLDRYTHARDEARTAVAGAIGDALFEPRKE